MVDPRWISPVAPELVELARSYRLVVSVEDNGRSGGAGSLLAQALRDADVDVPLRDMGIPQRFLDHATRAAILERIGLTPQALALSIVEDVTALADGGALVERVP